MKTILILHIISFIISSYVSAQPLESGFSNNKWIDSKKDNFVLTFRDEKANSPQYADKIGIVENLKSNKEYYESATTEISETTQSETNNDGVIVIKKINFNKTTFSPIITSNTKIYFSTSNGSIKCIGLEGEIIWEYNTNGLIYSSLLKDKDLIIAITSEGDLFTINANNGDLVQVIGIGESITTDIKLIDLEYNDTRTKGIVFGTVYGNIYCYELYFLEMVWENNLSEERIVSKPLVVDNKIIFETSEIYYCINSMSGTLIWKWQKKNESKDKFFQSDLISDGSSVFYIDSDAKLVSIDILLGTERWKKREKISASGILFITANKNELIVHSTKNQLLLVNHSSGKVIKEIDLPDELKNSLPNCIMENDTVKLIGFDNGIICKLDYVEKIAKIIYIGSARVISIVSLGGNEYLSNSLDGNLIHFSLE